MRLAHRPILIPLAFCLSVLVAAAAEDAFADVLKPVFKELCVSCHGQNGKVKGKVNLLEIDSLEAFMADPDVIAEILGAADFPRLVLVDLDPESARRHLPASLAGTEIHGDLGSALQIAAGAPVAEGGRLLVSDEPGLGVSPDEDVLGEPVAAYP